MPKLLVLFDASTQEIAQLADAVAEGARSVRFAEVDVRRLDAGVTDWAPETRHGALDTADELSPYDAILVGLTSAPDAGDRWSALLGRSSASLSNKVGSAFVGADGEDRHARLWSALTPMADRGMILVPSRFAASDEDRLEAARRLGKRVADVVGWITHARSHHHH